MLTFTHQTAAMALGIGSLSLMPQEPTTSTPGQIEVSGVTYPYQLIEPRDVDEDEAYPLVVFLHGRGERGRDNEAQLAHFPERMLEDDYRAAFPCFVLAPQCPLDMPPDGSGAGRWAAVRGESDGGALGAMPTELPPMIAVRLALQHVARTEPIDVDRIYITGLSMGGTGLFDLVARRPSWFAAAAPVCGRNDPSTAARIAGVPFSIWHGDEDAVISPKFSRQMARALEAAGADVTYTELERTGHDSWERAYGEGGALPWLFEQRRDPARGVRSATRELLGAIEKKEHIAFLGDSITQAGNAPGGYVDLLRTDLAESKPGTVVIPAGISGHRVPDLMARYRADVIEKKASLVFLYIGINDVWHSTSGNGTSPEAYEAGLRTLVRDFRDSGAAVVLATPTVIGEKPVGENDLDGLLEQYASISRTVAEEEGATLCDLRRAFIDHLSLFNRADAHSGILTTDGVHLNDAGNHLVAMEAAHALASAARSRVE